MCNSANTSLMRKFRILWPSFNKVALWNTKCGDLTLPRQVCLGLHSSESCLLGSHPIQGGHSKLHSPATWLWPTVALLSFGVLGFGILPMVSSNGLVFLLWVTDDIFLLWWNKHNIKSTISMIFKYIIQCH